MNTKLSNFGSARLRKPSAAARLSVRVILALLLVLCSSHFAAASATARPCISCGLPFAVADFDGDHRPDLASVQTGSDSSHDYWVRFGLSTTGREYVRITAPEGGLLVEARDVNGDNAVDLVVASAWLNRPVAVLLNDGHGNFSEVGPSHYDAAFGRSSSDWNTLPNAQPSALGLPQQSSLGEMTLARCGKKPLAKRGPLRLRSTLLSAGCRVVLRAGRAPPGAVL